MIKKLPFIFILLFSIVFADKTNQIHCTRELKPTLDTLRQLPEIDALVEEILEEGPLTIQFNDRLSKKFGGYWDPANRTILITKKSNRNEAERITTLLFEMHNALRTKDFEKLDSLAARREIRKEEFIRKSEHIEYENCLSTSYLLNLGIQQRLFPKASAWRVHDNFEDHFQLMQRTGHAAWYASAYKKMG